MEKQEIFIEYQKAVREIYEEENLLCLRGEKDNYELMGKPILSWHSQVTRKCKVKYQQFDNFKNIDDLLLRSDEIMHFTAQLYLIRPYINNPLDDRHYVSGWERWVYPNNQNLEAKRYYMYGDITFQNLYNYWHRIGNLIAAFFPNLINSDRVYFHTAFDIIPQQYHGLESYKWLKNFRETEYRQLNNKRREIVHYTSSDTDLKYKHIFSKGTKEDIEAWVAERHQIPDYFKKQIQFTLEGFWQTLTMLEEIDKVLFNDIP